MAEYMTVDVSTVTVKLILCIKLFSSDGKCYLIFSVSSSNSLHLGFVGLDQSMFMINYRISLSVYFKDPASFSDPLQ